MSFWIAECQKCRKKFAQAAPSDQAVLTCPDCNHTFLVKQEDQRTIGGPVVRLEK